MARYSYFEILESLSAMVSQAVFLACHEPSKRDAKEMSRIRSACDARICELEDTLFSDFLPPLKRDTIAACAHHLARIIARASDMQTALGTASLPYPLREEAQICIHLAKLLHEDIGLLRSIRKPSEMPALREYREYLSKGRCAHASLLSKIPSSTFPRSLFPIATLCDSLRSELAIAFDKLIEIMLNNI